MINDLKQKIFNRELSIYAEIRFDHPEEALLDKTFKSIAPTGDTRFLTRKNKYFTYCKERDVWYGSETKTHLPSISLKTLIELYTQTT